MGHPRAAEELFAPDGAFGKDGRLRQPVLEVETADERPVAVLELEFAPGPGQSRAHALPVLAGGVDEHGPRDAVAAHPVAGGAAAAAQDQGAVFAVEPCGMTAFEAGAARGGRPEGGLGDRGHPVAPSYRDVTAP